MIAAADEAKSPPDGYTLMMGTQTIFAVGPILYRKTVTLDPAKDFAGVTLTGASPLVLVANPAFPAHTVADVIAMAKANPGQINFGTGGVGTTPHMTAELFEHEAGIRMVHVAYRGEAPAINDAVAGQIPMMFANLSAVMGHLKGGTLRGIAVTSAQRAPTAPDLRTVAETIPGFAAESWLGIVAPAGTPRDILERLNAAARKALASADTRARLAQLGMSNNSSSPEEFDAYIKSEDRQMGPSDQRRSYRGDELEINCSCEGRDDDIGHCDPGITGSLCVTPNAARDFRFGSKADIGAGPTYALQQNIWKLCASRLR